MSIQIPIALQAYSLRTIFEKNPLEAMVAIKTAGYDGVEFYGTHFKPELYAALLQQTGLVCAGWHTGLDALEDDFDATIARNLAVGNRLIAVPWFDADTQAGWRDFAGRLNALAAKCARYGIRIGYHNHAHEFKMREGALPWDTIAQNTASQVFLQLDTGNALSGGADVMSTLEKYPWRNRSMHFKPFSVAEQFVPAIGDDDVPWADVIDYCDKRGATDWIVVEYEDIKDPVGAVTKSLAALHALRPR